MNEIHYELDYVAIREAARELLASTGPKSIVPYFGSEIPAAIARTKPVGVKNFESCLCIEYGDDNGHFGLEVTPGGTQPGNGVYVIDGVNYYEY